MPHIYAVPASPGASVIDRQPGHSFGSSGIILAGRALPPARPRPALAERAALANPHDDRGSRSLGVERQQKRDDSRLVPPEEHGAGAAQA